MDLDKRLNRLKSIIGDNGIRALSRAHIAVFGLGGVGSHAAEALARSGIGRLTLVDSDIICASNINRQIFALDETVGMPKTAVAAGRLMSINPHLKLDLHQVFFDAETRARFDFSRFDYILDAIDTVSPKLFLIETAVACGVPIICSMGTGNKLDPGRLKIADISKTEVCPLARVMRRELKKRGIKGVEVVYSDECPLTAEAQDDGNRRAPGSAIFVPAAAGLMMASHAVRRILGGDLCSGFDS